MILSLLTESKRLKGGAVLLAVYFLKCAGVDVEATQIVAAAGAIYSVIGWIHAIIKWKNGTL
jgi:hypothetical protein